MHNLTEEEIEIAYRRMLESNVINPELHLEISHLRGHRIGDMYKETNSLLGSPGRLNPNDVDHYVVIDKTNEHVYLACWHDGRVDTMENILHGCILQRCPALDIEDRSLLLSMLTQANSEENSDLVHLARHLTKEECLTHQWACIRAIGAE